MERELLYKYFRGETSEAEEQTIMEWAGSSPDNYRKYLNEREIWNALLIHSAILAERKAEHPFRRFIHRLLPYAAILSGLVLLVGGLYLYNRKETVSRVVVADINEPTLLSEDSSIKLSGRSFSISQGDATIQNDAQGGMLSYQAKGNDKKEAVKTNRLIIPCGKTYRLQLSDGTRVTMNAASELVFPSRFERGKRIVSLKGEAYFEVSKDIRHPFIVQTGTMSVRVLGTSFNVNCYDDEPAVRTTLVTGSVAIEQEGKTVHIRPSEQYEYVRATKQADVKKVNTELYTSWLNNEYIFRNATLDEILTQLKRWYGFDVQYDDNGLRNNHFSLRINRDVSLDKFLELINNTEQVYIERIGNTIIIKHKKTEGL